MIEMDVNKITQARAEIALGKKTTKEVKDMNFMEFCDFVRNMPDSTFSSDDETYTPLIPEIDTENAEANYEVSAYYLDILSHLENQVRSIFFENIIEIEYENQEEYEKHKVTMLALGYRIKSTRINYYHKKVVKYFHVTINNHNIPKGRYRQLPNDIPYYDDDYDLPF